MLIGIISDIHEAVEDLDEAISYLTREGVDQFVFLGDLCCHGERLNETCTRFSGLPIRGVWGNHDFGLCEDARLGILDRYSSDVIEFARSLCPSIQIERTYLCHVEPWLDPNKLEDLWYLGGFPDSDCKRSRLFESPKWDIAIAGHFHCWYWCTPEGAMDWEGQHPIDLSEGRHYVIIDACFNGSCATFDTDSKLLTPITWKTKKETNESQISASRKQTRG